jgi:GNAT superfamily N-acetyltransferase
MTEPAIRTLLAAEVDASAQALAHLLLDCVAGGASVNFMADFSLAEATRFWRGVAAAAQDGRIILVAEDDQGPVGTVQLIPVAIPNQPHRAEVAKMLVHRRARNQGLGARLMAAIEAQARMSGRTLLVLDTATGEAGERLYARLGWVRFGEVPGYALFPDGRLGGASFFYKQL